MDKCERCGSVYSFEDLRMMVEMGEGCFYCNVYEILEQEGLVQILNEIEVVG